MTCIIGIAHEGRVYIGGDSMASDGWCSRQTALRKVFRTGDFLIGYTSSFRMGQILQYHLTVPPQAEGVSNEQYMVVEFVEAVRACLKDKGYAKVDNNREEGGTFLVGYKSELYEVAADFQVNHYINGLVACGSGDAYAMGALVALHKMAPQKRIINALEIASQLACTVCGPFYVEEL